MKILIVSSYLPFPLTNGGHIRLYNLIKALSKKHKITLVCERRGFQTDQDVAEVEKLCEEVYTVDRKQQWSSENIAKAGFSTYPFLLVGHTLPAMKAKIVELMMQKTFDVIHVETFYVFQNVPKTYVPIVLVEHNIEYMVYQRYAQTAKPYLRPLLSADIAKIRYWEEKFWKKAHALVAVSKDDAAKMKRPDVFVVPNGVDIKKFTVHSSRFKEKKERKILFIGDFKWIQNRNSVEWILKDIWPKIAARVKGEGGSVTLWIVGKSIPDSLRSLTDDENVIFDENAPRETEKIFQQSTILLAPIKVGGGTQYKILEAMASGVPVVTTNLGAEGIDCNQRTDMIVADDSETLAKKTVSVLQDQSQYETIARNGRECIEKKYSWEIIAEKLDKVYTGVVSS